MASLAIGLVGAAIGGPLLGLGAIGASVGFMAGSMLGNVLDPPQSQGPRLTDLKLQTSSYGAVIPICYGVVRIAGNVIDQTDLVEHEHTSGGKGGPEVTNYTYSASVDVLICEGPIAAVRRIWADSRLVYDARPEAEPVELIDFTLYLGDEDQLADPTFEALHGAGNVPAYRGLAHIVFADLDLSSYGNRLPQFTFEVVARGHTDSTIRRVWVNNDEDVEYGNTFVGPSDPKPMITRWLGTTDEASSDILVESLPGTYNVQISQPWGPNSWTFYGRWLSADGTRGIPIWLDPSLPMTGAQVSGLCDAEPIISGNPLSSRYQYAYCSPLFPVGASDVDPGVYVANIAFSPDQRYLMIFTSPTTPVVGTPVIDHWYLFKDLDPVSIADGEIDPALDWYQLGMPNWYHREVQNICNGLESNLKWLWVVYTAGDVHQQVRLFHIGADNKLTFSTSSGYGETSEPKTYNYPSLKVVNGEGYAGVAVGETFALFSRYPRTDTLDAALADIVLDISERAGLDASQVDVTDLPDYVPGYVIASQMEARAAIEALRAPYFFDAVESDNVVKFIKRGHDPAVTIPDDDLGAYPYGSTPPPLATLTRKQEVELPAAVSMVYYNPDADYQNNSQTARRQTVLSQQQVTLQAPIVMRDANAKLAAEAILYQAWIERDARVLFVPRKYLYLEPTDVISAQDRLLRIVDKEEQPSGVVKFETVPAALFAILQGGIAGSAGGFTPPVVSAPSYARLQILDIPLQVGDSGFGYYTAVSAPDPFTGATVLESPDDSTYAILNSTTSGNMMGAASTALAVFGGGNIPDEINSVDVVLLRGSLTSTTTTGLIAGTNAALLGDEIIGFRDATLVGALTYRLSGLMRGRHGTEWAMRHHSAGERFVLLPATFVPIDPSQRGVARYHKAISTGLAITSADAQQISISDACVRPFSPVNLAGGAVGNDVTLQWTRRARLNATWADGHDVPLDELVEAYVVQIWDSTYRYCARTTVVTAATFTYTSAMQVSDFGSNQQTVYFTVGQIGLLGIGTQAAGSAPGGGGSNGTPLSPITPYGLSPVTGGICAKDVPVLSDLSSVSGSVTLPTWLAADEWVVKFTTGTTGGGVITIASLAGQREETRQAVLSTLQCGTPVGVGCQKEGTFIAFRFYLTGNPEPGVFPTLLPSTTYYISITTTVGGGAVATQTVF